MPNVLKGNYKAKIEINVQAKTSAETLEDRFEREALKKVGGSVAFVAKKKVTWSLPEDK
jgi:hypothetical protein